MKSQKLKIKKKKDNKKENRKSSLPPIYNKNYYQIIPYKKVMKSKKINIIIWVFKV
jgi:hypothetical protein